MRIPWEERRARVAATRAAHLQPQEKPRFALRLARFFIGDDYDEEVLPASIVNFGYISLTVAVVAVAVVIGFILSKLFS